MQSVVRAVSTYRRSRCPSAHHAPAQEPGGDRAHALRSCASSAARQRRAGLRGRRPEGGPARNASAGITMSPMSSTAGGGGGEAAQVSPASLRRLLLASGWASNYRQQVFFRRGCGFRRSGRLHGARRKRTPRPGRHGQFRGARRSKHGRGFYACAGPHSATLETICDADRRPALAQSPRLYGSGRTYGR